MTLHPLLRLLPSLSSPAMRYLLRLSDLALVVGSSWLAWRLSHPGLEQPARYHNLVLAAALLLGIFLNLRSRSYRGGQVREMVLELTGAWVAALTLGLLWLFATKSTGDYSRVWAISWSLIGLSMLLAGRFMVYMVLRFVRSHGYNYRRVAVVGTGATISYLLSRLGQARWTGYRMVDFIPPNNTQRIEERGSDPSVHEIWLCLPPGNTPVLENTMRALRFSAKRIRLVPDVFTYNLLNLDISQVSGVPMVELTASRLDNGLAQMAKGVFDRVVALFILALISPLMLAIAVGVKLTSEGPVFFRQRRHGWNGDVIEVWKFRSMKVHTELDTITQATLGDPRVTRFGAFLRRTSLDELPQFINVLQGQMSIIGPRPHAIEHNERYKHLVPGYMLRHKVKPGITGWAQVNGLRGETDTLDKMERRVEHDLYYINNWSFFLDLRIFVGTVFKGFSSKNAY